MTLATNLSGSAVGRPLGVQSLFVSERRALGTKVRPVFDLQSVSEKSNRSLSRILVSSGISWSQIQSKDISVTEAPKVAVNFWFDVKMIAFNDIGIPSLLHLISLR